MPTPSSRQEGSGLLKMLRNPQFINGIQQFITGMTEHPDPGFHSRMALAQTDQAASLGELQREQQERMAEKQRQARTQAFLQQMTRSPQGIPGSAVDPSYRPPGMPDASPLAGMDPSQQQYLKQMMQVDPAAAMKAITAHRFQSGGQRRIVKGADGKSYYEDTKEPVLPGVSASGAKPTALMQHLEAAGLKPGSEEYNKALLAKIAPSGMELTTSPDGSVSFRQGQGVGGGMAKATQNKVQAKILGSGDLLQHIASIRSNFKPEFQQLGTRAGAAWTAIKERLNMGENITAAEKKTLSEFTTFRADATQLFANTLKELSGVAVNPTEFKRAEGWIPNPGTGIFDGDSPTQITAKLDRFEEFAKRAYMKYHYINKNGLTIDDVDVDDMPGIVQERGDELYKEALSRGMKDFEAKVYTKSALREEFGIKT